MKRPLRDEARIFWAYVGPCFSSFGAQKWLIIRWLQLSPNSAFAWNAAIYLSNC